MMYYVYHSDPPDFLARRSIENFPHGYSHVATVDTESVDAAFRLTQNIDNTWTKNGQVMVIGKEPMYRSTSVGDVVKTENGRYFRCELLGWSQFTPKNNQ